MTPAIASPSDRFLARLWHADAPLTAAGLLMLGALGAALVGLVVDPRIITGAPAWLKPVKFGASTAIYSFTLAWIFGQLPGWPRMRRLVGWTTAVVLVVEVGLIDLQAWRGTTSHFNTSTPFDGAVFTIMGMGILLQTATSVAVLVALWRTPFADRALAWALRLGMAITIAGASIGGLMPPPTAAQREAFRQTGQLPVSGAHTVGAADGGPGLPGVRWSADHGDLRVPHFLGLHAIQALAVLALLLRRSRWSDDVRASLVRGAAASYALLVAILLWQALRGQPVARPDGVTLWAVGAWTIATMVAAIAAVRRSSIRAHAVTV